VIGTCFQCPFKALLQETSIWIKPLALILSRYLCTNMAMATPVKVRLLLFVLACLIVTYLPSGTTKNGQKRTPAIISSSGGLFALNSCSILTNYANRLDRGEGKNLSLPECSRKQLEAEVCPCSLPKYNLTRISIAYSLSLNGTTAQLSYHHRLGWENPLETQQSVRRHHSRNVGRCWRGEGNCQSRWLG
jgi:hypothetical protein